MNIAKEEVSEILENVKIAQVEGKISSKQEAIEFVKALHSSAG